MKRQNWNANWHFQRLSSLSQLEAMVGLGATQGRTVHLPHDAMIEEPRTQATKNQQQTGFYPGGLYQYAKQFTAPAAWQGQNVILEFEGVYKNARVYVNGDYAGGCHYGYTNFYVKLNDFLQYGQTNEVKVIVNNADEENSRWYSGSGIYRPVKLIVAGPIHLPLDSVRVQTPDVTAALALVQVDLKVTNQELQTHQLQVHTVLKDAKGAVVNEEQTKLTAFGQQTALVRQHLSVTKPALWSPAHPHLYQCVVTVEEGAEVRDETSVTFGIRRLTVDAKRGVQLNGEPILLRGACVHHDNGIIGATTLAAAELRKCQQLKAAGFNTLRSAHHPMSKALLAACDQVGMLVLDELADSWTRPKNSNDYANEFMDHWPFDVTQLVAKDFNHPSVLGYISGNEIQEAGTPKGAQLNRTIAAKFHALDDTRPVISAINGLLIAMPHLGQIIADLTGQSPASLQAANQKGSADQAQGSDGLNASAAILKGPLADGLAQHPLMTDLLEEFADGVDIAGYNYLTGRHALEATLKPNRVILGTETFPSDISRLWQIVRQHPNVIGDMTWTGRDYLGEAGMGLFYYDGRQPFMANWPISVAGIGDLDLIGDRRPISYYRQIIYGLRQAPYIGVQRLNRPKVKPAVSAWPWRDEVASWTWPDQVGQPASVNVYSASEQVELRLNGKVIGRQPAGPEHDYFANFTLPYAPGDLSAVNVDHGHYGEQITLTTAGPVAAIKAEAEQTTLQANGEDLAYVALSLVDAAGNLNRAADQAITVTIAGPLLLQGFGSADPATTESYQATTTTTFEGRALLVLRATAAVGPTTITLRTADGLTTRLAVQSVTPTPSEA